MKLLDLQSILLFKIIILLEVQRGIILGNFNYAIRDDKKLEEAQKWVKKFRAYLENHEDTSCTLGDAVYKAMREVAIKYGIIKEITKEEKKKEITQNKINKEVEEYSKPENIDKILEYIETLLEERNQESLQPLWDIVFKIKPDFEPKDKANFEQITTQIFIHLRDIIGITGIDKIIEDRIEEYGL